ncbi:alpha/beta fold hydrolase [Pusillimonas sp. NJUB218]|uniref:alpha/beta fold hydrolase n=1 Tax=Pusillimonas sp. NJUB218 TaxID=2023230 RepID=UPI000F4CA30B|nr:alpha/beta fold hydrolase [Pusillimonas sp. NJUB218]ROT46585.1 hypothetical protein CHR62_01225 [Pusillimonas sp. NJUB218]
MNYKTFGRGGDAWVTLSHPIGSSHEVWGEQVKALASTYNVLVYDVRGHGVNPGATDSLRAQNLDDLVDDVLAIWRQLGISSSHFVGLSLGGCIGVGLALRAPERVNSLMVVNSRLHMDDAARAMWQQRAALVEREGMTPVVRPTLERWFTSEFLAAHTETLASVEATLQGTSALAFADCARVLAGLQLQPRLSSLTMPVRFVTGEQDTAVASQFVADYAAVSAGFELIRMRGPHLLNIENPVGFNHCMLDFIETIECQS